MNKIVFNKFFSTFSIVMEFTFSNVDFRWNRFTVVVSRAADE